LRVSLASAAYGAENIARLIAPVRIALRIANNSSFRTTGSLFSIKFAYIMISN
jgi:hypothetical protein